MKNRSFLLIILFGLYTHDMQGADHLKIKYAHVMARNNARAVDTKKSKNEKKKKKNKEKLPKAQTVLIGSAFAVALAAGCIGAWWLMTESDDHDASDTEESEYENKQCILALTSFGQ